ncbi:MAG: hypothetical protein IKC50_04460 [Oscillospiraceae bacterium]|nr:hypothetical protein [Oscillospiraceae bacterium]
MKKRIVLFVLLLCAALLTACGAPANSTSASEQDTTARDTVPQTKIDFLGGWQSGDATMSVVPARNAGDCAVQIRSGSAEWSFNAVFHEETAELEYQNGSKFERSYTEDGSIAEEKQLHADCSGIFRLNNNGEIEWTDTQEDRASEHRFTRTYSETPAAEDLIENFYLPVSRIGQGGAGSSLKNAATACEIVAYAYDRGLWNANPAELQAALRTARDSLSDKERSAFDANYTAVTRLMNATLKSTESRIEFFEDAGVGEEMKALMQNDLARFSWATLFGNHMALSFG